MNVIALKLLLFISTGEISFMNCSCFIHIRFVLIFSHTPRLLGFRKAMPVTGRKIDLILDVLRLADSKLQETFFISPKPNENICLTGKCDLYCDFEHPICGKGRSLEGSFTAFYPMFEGSDVIVSYHGC